MVARPDRRAGPRAGAQVTGQPCAQPVATGSLNPDASRRLRGDRCKCPSCGQLFNSTYAFDRHRVGRFESERHCLSTVDMTARGMTTTTDGFWVAKAMPIRPGGNLGRPAFVSSAYLSTVVKPADAAATEARK